MRPSDVLSLVGREAVKRTKSVRYAVDAIGYRWSVHGATVEKLHGRWLGQPAVVVANGPSLNKTPLDLFVGTHAIGMNKIDLIYSRTAWRPDLVVCENNIVARQHGRAMVSHGLPVYFSWKCRWFVPADTRPLCSFYLTRNSDSFSTDLPAGLGSASTVTFVALQFAYYLGANPVILVGCDHSFAYEGAAGAYRKMEGADRNHFDPNYFGKGSYWGTPDLLASERGYRAAKAQFEADGRKVYDATVDGRLEVFPKISIEQALSLLRPGQMS